MPDLPIEKRFAVLCEIVRAQHFAWRDAVAELCPGVDPTRVVERMWELTGATTGQAYARRIDPARPLPLQVAEGICWSSQSMGEDAVAEAGKSDAEAFVRHRDCPWVHWHRRTGHVGEDRPGCDAWFRTTVDAVNRAFGSRLRFETVEALPDGGSSCLRRLWVEP